MGRPSKAAERTQQILEAFEICVVKYGLAGSTLERIAEEAGVKRSILRHYIGNRDALLDAFLEKVVHRYREELRLLFREIRGEDKIEQLLGILFPDVPYHALDSIIVIEELIALAGKHERARELMLGYVECHVEKIAEVLRAEYPTISPQQCWDTAYGLLSLNYNQESLVSLSLPGSYLRAARKNARLLLSALEESSRQNEV